MQGRQSLHYLLKFLRRSIELQQNAALRVKSPEEKHLYLLHLRPLCAILPSLLVRDHSRGGSEDRIDDPQIVRTKRRTRLCKIDDRIHKLGSLHLGGAPAELHIGLHAVRLEVALDNADRLGGDALSLEILHRLDLRVVRHREDPADRIRRRLGVAELADVHHVRPVLIHPVVAADAGVEKAEFHIAAHLLRAQQTALDFLIVNRRIVGTG